MQLLSSSMTNFQPVPVPSLPAASHFGYDPVADVMEKTPCVSLCCRDIGLDCSFEATGETPHLTLREFIRHAQSSHNMAVLSAEMLLIIKESMKK
jgi:predicted small metal-binding protein